MYHQYGTMAASSLTTLTCNDYNPSKEDKVILMIEGTVGGTGSIVCIAAVLLDLFLKLHTVIVYRLHGYLPGCKRICLWNYLRHGCRSTFGRTKSHITSPMSYCSVSINLHIIAQIGLHRCRIGSFVYFRSLKGLKCYIL